MSDETWNLERIYAALGNNPEINKRITREINKATQDELPEVFARWRKHAEETLEGIARGRSADLDAADDAIVWTVNDLKARAERLRRSVA